MRDALPDVPIPLRAAQATTLSLRACLDRAYEEARYGEEIDYAQPPKPALGGADVQWAKQLIQRSKRR